MNNEKTGHFKKRLTDELHKLEGELKGLGWQNPETGDWEATGGDIDGSATESDELADRQEEYGENRAEIEEIEIHWRNVKRALQKIEEGTFGICEISGDDIEEDRLEVNPSARTCKAHMEEEGELGA
jgi:RNA polymerase-binding transcription factor DksA